LVFREGERKKK